MSDSKCFCHFNGFEVKDAKARADIEALQGEDASIRKDISAFKEDEASYKETHASEEVGVKTEEGGEIFNDYENNVAIGSGASASGIRTKAGNKAFKILAITKKEKAHTYDITLRGDVSSGADPYVIGDIVQITANVNFHNCFKISGISVADGNSIISIERVDSRSVSTLSLGTEHPNNTENWLYVAGKDNGEISPWLTGATATGEDVIASGSGAFGSGYDNEVTGDYGFSSGRNNKAGYSGFTSGAQNEAGDYAFATGNGNKATGIDSFASGVNTQATKYGARAGGSGTVARNEFATAEGLGTQTYRQAQFVVGQYNKSHNNTLFEVGNGSDNSNRSNAFEVYEDGSISAGGVKTTPEELSVLKSFVSAKRKVLFSKDDKLSGTSEDGYIPYSENTSLDPALNITIPGLANYNLYVVRSDISHVLCVPHFVEQDDGTIKFDLIGVGTSPFGSYHWSQKQTTVVLRGIANKETGDVIINQNSSYTSYHGIEESTDSEGNIIYNLFPKTTTKSEVVSITAIF